MDKDNKEPEAPKSITEDYYAEVIEKEFGKNAKIKKVTEVVACATGENYGSELLRVQVDVELEDKTEKTVSYIHKAMPKSEIGAQMIKMMGLLPREVEIYSEIIPKFEKLYKNVGKVVHFAPKCFHVRPDHEAFILEDLKPQNFTNGKRQTGLTVDQVKKVLEKLAEYHAASAVIFERDGYSQDLIEGAFKEDFILQFEQMQKAILAIYVECLAKTENLKPYISKFQELTKSVMEKFEMFTTFNPNEFNVLNHGDLWVNNIMFQFDENENITETFFVDFAAAKYGNPSQDLWYFLISSSGSDFRIQKFDYFIKYYHDHLVENLKLLEYPKEIPKLVNIQIQLLTNPLWPASTVQGVLPIILIDPTELATMENFISEGDAGMQFKLMQYTNPRYIEALENILPWLENKGLLDF